MKIVLLAVFCLFASVASQGDRNFCDPSTERKDGWYVHPTCNYLYKCQNNYTYETPTLPNNIICVPESELFGPSHPDVSYCEWKNNGVYSHSECHTYNSCWEKRGRLLSDKAVGELLCGL